VPLMETMKSTKFNRISVIAALSLSLVASAFAQDYSHFTQASKTWNKVTSDMVAFEKVVKSKKWKAVHEAAFAVRDDALLLPGDSKALAKDKMAKLKEHLKMVSGLAGELDEAGDANNGKLVMSLASKFRVHINSIPSLYPKGALHSGSAPQPKNSAVGHKGHH